MQSSLLINRHVRRADRLIDPTTRTRHQWTSAGLIKTGGRIQESPGGRANVWLADSGERTNLLSDSKHLTIRYSVAENVW